jgi:type VI secretion system protein ImpG
VLSEFFGRYASINSFTETVLKTADRGEVTRWPTQIGRRPVL